MTLLLSLVFFASGAAALLFETLWFRQAGLMLGNSVWATTLVTSSFMGGLALGNEWAGRRGERWGQPLRVYAGLECAIGVAGVLLVLLLPQLTGVMAPLFGQLIGHSVVLNATRFAIAFVCLLVPAIAMGATLPTLVLALTGSGSRFGWVIGTLYGWNTLGAVAGAVAGEVLLIESLGVRGTAFVAMSLNAFAVLVSFGLSKMDQAKRSSAAATSQPPGQENRSGRRLQAAAFLAGALLLSLEVVWFRLLQLFVFGTSLSFAMMLAVVLLGIGAGGLIAGHLLREDDDAGTWLPVMALVTGALTAWTYSALLDVVGRYSAGYSISAPADVLAIAGPLMLPTSLMSGALFTVMGAAFKASGFAPSRAAGTLAFANTLGAMLGSLMTTFVLLPRLGMEYCIALFAALYGLVAFLSRKEGGTRERQPRLASPSKWAAGVAYAALLLFFPFGLMERQYALRPAAGYLRQGHRIAAHREGLTETVTYLSRENWGESTSFRLLTNSYSMSGTGFYSARYMKMFVHWPVAVHPKPRHALLISYGVGMTAKALTQTSALQTIDVVDISKDILELGRLVFPKPGTFPLDDARVQVHVEDGRFFLLTSNRKFDIITAEPPPPKGAGIVNLYSKEYFRLIRSRLAPGGITTYWLPVYQMSNAESKAIMRGFCEVFEDCSLWTGIGLEWMLIGTNGASGPVSDAEFGAQWADPMVGPEMRSLALETPESLAATFLGDARTLRELTAGVPPLDDDHPLRVSSRVAPAVDPFYVDFMTRTPVEATFESSDLIRRLVPPATRQRTLAAFETQRRIDLIEARRLTGVRTSLTDLDAVLASAAPRPSVLALFITSEPEIHAARRALARGVDHPTVRQALAIDAIADRDYLRALSEFEAAGPPSDGVERRLRALTLGLAGRKAEVLAMLGAESRTDAVERAERDWLAQRFGGSLPPPSPER